MKFKHMLFVVLTTLALILALIGVSVPGIAGGRGGLGGEVYVGQDRMTQDTPAVMVGGASGGVLTI